jgi:hypothetical protein
LLVDIDIDVDIDVDFDIDVVRTLKSVVLGGTCLSVFIR